MVQQRTFPEPVRILFIAANPRDEAYIRLDEEIRAITHKVLATTQRECLTFHQIWAARPQDLLQACNRFTPDIVHLSAHGNATGQLILMDESGHAKPVSNAALQALFTTLKDNIRVVMFNACFSQKQAHAITTVIDCAIGMQTAISDQAAILFASSFYQALGFGRSVQEAFDQGKVALQIEGIPEHHTPQLFLRKGVRADQIHIIHDTQQRYTQLGYQQQMRTIETALRQGKYSSAYQQTVQLWQEAGHTLPVQEQAYLKFLEALIHLDGKRPSSHSPSVMKRAEALLEDADALYPCWAYKSLLALFKQDVARTGLQVKKYRAEARACIRQAEQRAVTPEDRTILRLFVQCQPQLYREYQHLFAKEHSSAAQ